MENNEFKSDLEKLIRSFDEVSVDKDSIIEIINFLERRELIPENENIKEYKEELYDS
jgi:hypothetical protein